MDYFIFEYLKVGVRGWLVIPMSEDIEHYIHIKQKKRKKKLCWIV